LNEGEFELLLKDTCLKPQVLPIYFDMMKLLEMVPSCLFYLTSLMRW